MSEGATTGVDSAGLGFGPGFGVGTEDRAFDEGVLVGILVGSGHFGGDGRQPHVTLKMHVRHESLFRWLGRAFPGGRLFGPYHHGGREYYQWMARGPFLRDVLMPILERRLTPELDRKAFDAVQEMRVRYARLLAPAASLGVPNTAAEPAPAPVPGDRHHRRDRIPR